MACSRKSWHFHCTATPNPRRKLSIWSWGAREHSDPACALTIDLRLFRSEYARRDIRKEDGTSLELQEHMQAHPDYERLMNLIVAIVEARDLDSVSFVCSWGKHRSVAFAEILKQELYPRSKVRHARFLDLENGERDQKRTKRRKRDRRRKAMSVDAD